MNILHNILDDYIRKCLSAKMEINTHKHTKKPHVDYVYVDSHNTTPYRHTMYPKANIFAINIHRALMGLMLNRKR